MLGALVVSTMRAAKELAIFLNAMAYDPAPAMLADGCQQLNGAFKAIKHVRMPMHDYFKRLVICVSAGLALWLIQGLFHNFWIQPRQHGGRPFAYNRFHNRMGIALNLLSHFEWNKMKEPEPSGFRSRPTGLLLRPSRRAEN
jgi:hypothetical protein